MGLFKKKASGTIKTELYHVEGLPLPEKSLCEVSLLEEHLRIRSGTSEFSIRIEKITNSEFKREDKPSGQGGIWMVCFLLISYINSSNQMDSVTFSIAIAEAKGDHVKNAKQIAELLSSKVKGMNRSNSIEL